MVDIDANDVLRTVREAATVPIPEQPRRSEFATEDLFVQAWDDWQSEALTRALTALDTIAAATTDAAAPSAPWAPGELVTVSMLRAALAQAERDSTGSWPYSPVELAQVRELVERTNPEVTIPITAVQQHAWSGHAWDATHWLAPGVYGAVGVGDQQRYRLVVGPAGDQVAGEASAAFRVGDADRATVDQISIALERFAPGQAARTLERVARVVEESGRDLGDAGTRILRAAHAERSRPSTPALGAPVAALQALRDRARHVNAVSGLEEASPVIVDVPSR